MKRNEKTEIKTKNNINWDLTLFWVRIDKNTCLEGLRFDQGDFLIERVWGVLG